MSKLDEILEPTTLDSWADLPDVDSIKREVKNLMLDNLTMPKGLRVSQEQYDGIVAYISIIRKRIEDL